MTRTYEGMFLLDNDVVRSGWAAAKGVVTGILEKGGARVVACRRWDERRLAYPIKRRKRATYLLAYYELDPQAVPGIVRDLDINETVLRYLFKNVDEVPAKEIELTEAESADDFSVPEPPEDDYVVPEPEPEPKAEEKAKEKTEEGETKGEDAPKEEPEKAEVGAAEATKE